MAADTLMTVTDMFRFADGRTVFVGHVDKSEPFIGAATCQLCVNGDPVALVHIQGEMISDPTPPGLRSVSTCDSVALSEREVQAGLCVLRRVRVQS